jgi:phosphoglycerol transferase MdoB-like AlkP superfamily enzyme
MPVTAKAEFMSKTSSSSSNGIGVFGLLGVAFVVLKLTGYIDWSWWWVTAPFWGGFALFLGVLLIICTVTFILEILKKKS